MFGASIGAAGQFTIYLPCRRPATVAMEPVVGITICITIRITIDMGISGCVGIAISRSAMGRTVEVSIAVAIGQGGVYIMPDLVALVAGHVEQKTGSTCYYSRKNGNESRSREACRTEILYMRNEI